MLHFVTFAFYVLLGLTFLLYGMQAKELAALVSPLQIPVTTGVMVHDEKVKLASDLHHHMDKPTFKSLMKHSSELMTQLENRMLAARKHEWRKASKVGSRQAGLKMWFDYLLMKLAFFANF